MTFQPESQAQNRKSFQERAAIGVDEFASAIGVSKFTVHRRIKDGSLRTVRFGRRVLIPASELARLLQAEGGAQ